MDPQLLHDVDKIALALQAHFWPETVAEWMQVAVALLTLLTLLALVWYTRETVMLRTASERQVNIAQDQAEAASMPVLTFDVADRFVYPVTLSGKRVPVPDTEPYALWLRNCGHGPAFNITISVDDPDADLRFDCDSSVVVQDQRVPVSLVINPETPAQQKFGAVPPHGWEKISLPKRIDITITCDSINNAKYRTRIALEYMDDVEPWIGVDFVGMERPGSNVSIRPPWYLRMENALERCLDLTDQHLKSRHR